MCISVAEAEMHTPRRQRDGGRCGGTRTGKEWRPVPPGWAPCCCAAQTRLGKAPLGSGKPSCLEHGPGAPRVAEPRTPRRGGSEPAPCACAGARGRQAALQSPRVPRESPRRGHGGAGPGLGRARAGGGRREDVPAQVRHGGGSGRTGFGSAFRGSRRVALWPAAPRWWGPSERGAARCLRPGQSLAGAVWAAGAAEILQSGEGESLFGITPRFWFAMFETLFPGS